MKSTFSFLSAFLTENVQQQALLSLLKREKNVEWSSDDANNQLFKWRVSFQPVQIAYPGEKR
jgi:hypothetical protein